jgi:uncharacterized membrane protein
MASVGDTARDALGTVLREALKSVGDAGPVPSKSKNGGPMSSIKGLAAGAGLAAAAPLAKKGVDAVRANGGLSSASPTKLASKAGDKVGGNLKDVASSKIDEAGGAGGMMKKAAGGLLPGIGGDDDDSGGSSGGMPGVGKGRRMPVQQAVDVAVPLETAYNQWTQFEQWPEFMHRVTRVTQDDDCTVGFATKIWGKTKEFKAQIETQRPEQRIKWRVSEGMTHTGVVTFHEMAENLTRIEVNIDVDPGSLIEKAARGMRHVKRAVRADLSRFKAFIEMQELETGAWRGVIEDGELVEPHDDSYDEERDYSEIEDAYEDSDQDEDSEEEDEDGNGSHPQKMRRFKQQAEKSRSTPSRATSASSSSRTTGSSRSGGSSKSSSSRSSSSKPRSSSKSSGSSKSSSSKSSSSKSSSSKPRSSSKSGGSSRSSGTSKSSSSRSAPKSRRRGATNGASKSTATTKAPTKRTRGGSSSSSSSGRKASSKSRS